MFAVVKTGAKQYKVAAGDVIKVEKLEGEAGAKVTLDHVLMVGDDKGVKVGTPTVSGTVVTAEILEQARAAKIIVFKRNVVITIAVPKVTVRNKLFCGL